MKLYVCWGTHPEPFHTHPCRRAHRALLAAGYEPEVIKVRGLGVGPRFLQWTTEGRREVERVSGQKTVPVLVTDDGDVVVESSPIVEWAEVNPREPSGAS
ncbi:MAG TPA: glutathione S-transferase N-terminal domain-containing protein [Solirubrobacterales bacterium]|jgi:glutathione S-transferase|nr:glutathione S-transferase N-terminal domain-containing protein [Solirubrobacterales bacterium]